MISFFSRLLENDEFQNLQSCKECANKPTCTCQVFASVTNKVSEWSLTVNEMPKTPELQGGSAPTCRSHANLRTLHSLRSHMFYPIINNLAPRAPRGITLIYKCYTTMSINLWIAWTLWRIAALLHLFWNDPRSRSNTLKHVNLKQSVPFFCFLCDHVLEKHFFKENVSPLYCSKSNTLSMIFFLDQRAGVWPCWEWPEPPPPSPLWKIYCRACMLILLIVRIEVLMSIFFQSPEMILIIINHTRSTSASTALLMSTYSDSDQT